MAEALTPKERRDTLSRVIAALVFIFPIFGLFWAIASLIERFTFTTVAKFPVDPVSPAAPPIIHIFPAFLLKTGG